MKSSISISTAGLIVAILLSGVGIALVNAQQNEELTAELVSKPLNIARSAGNETPRPIKIEDIIATKEISSVEMSPDGENILFVVKEAVLDKNQNKLAVFTVRADGGAPTKVSEEKGISQIKWSPDSRFLTYTTVKNGSSQVWRMRPDGNSAEQLTNHPTGVGQYALSPDGTKIAFLASEVIRTEEKERAETQGVVFNHDLNVIGVMNKRWIRKPQQLWLFDVTKNTESKLYEQADQETSVFAIFWSPDSQKIAVVTTGVRLDTNIHLISLKTSEIIPLIIGGANLDLSWSPDSNSIAFFSDLGSKDNVRGRPRELKTLDVRFRKIHDVMMSIQMTGMKNKGWSSDGRNIYIEAYGARRSERGLYSVPADGGVIRKVTHGNGHLSQCSLNRDLSRASCILQNPTVPPEVTVIKLSEGLPRPITTLHPEYRNIRLSDVSELILTNKYGNPFNAFLLKPLDYVPGRRYPLVVILYNFSGEFFRDVFGNYPVQKFAADKYAVLCINISGLPYRVGNFNEGSMSEMYNPLASIEKGTERVVQMGIADPKRMGIMGWSYGSFVTDFTITHSDLFAAASSGDGGLYGASTYWLGDRRIQYLYDAVLGGPPYGETSRNWQKVSPSLNASKVRSPLLMEYIDLNISAGDFYTAIKKQGGAVELVIYPNAPHVFNQGQPKQSFYSMQRNLDWFNFWLQDKEDPAPEKQEQYARWRKMKEEIQKRADTTIPKAAKGGKNSSQ